MLSQLLRMTDACGLCTDGVSRVTAAVVVTHLTLAVATDSVPSSGGKSVLHRFKNLIGKTDVGEIASQFSAG